MAKRRIAETISVPELFQDVPGSGVSSSAR